MADADAMYLQQLDHLREDLESDMKHVEDKDHIGTCAACRKSVRKDDEACMVKQRYHHAKCFACQTCKKELRNIGYYEDSQGACHCEGCYMDKNVPKCDKCAKPITNRVVQYGGKGYHTECFTCSDCNSPLDGKSFFELGSDRRVCGECHQKKTAADGASMQCGHCLKPIVAQGPNFTCAKIGPNRYHNECVVCASCSVPLGDDIYIHAGQLLCKAHAIAAKSK